MIELKGLNKTYCSKQGDYHALKNISLKVAKGEIYGIIGRSGAGKSSLVRCVNLLERPDTGEVIVDGANLLELNAEALREKRHSIGMIFQHFNLLNSRTIYDNIALPLELIGITKPYIAKRVNALLELTGLSAHKNHYPAQLSGGQKQRVAIARALATSPKVLLSDEATSSLDPETTQSILSLLKQINRELNLTILLITHEMDVIKSICDRAGILDKGELIEEAPVLELFARPKSLVAKNFTQSALHIKLPDNLSRRLQLEATAGSRPIVKLTFLGANAEQPIMVSLLTKFNVTTNILQANLEMIHNSTVGITICELLGNPGAIEHSIEFIRSQNVEVEVLGYVN
ncbi:MAG: methionine ABC transporter ATP-binding protein [Gammaproteobacteria bacterium]|nr:methionine ABC transporter ATP-binding protein [Gammaproteobacteria bacterium]